MNFKKQKIVTSIILLIILVAASYCTSDATVDKSKTINGQSTEATVSVEKGQHLVIAGACHDCHSPKIMTEFGPKVDSSKLLSGHPANAPMPPINLDALQPGSWIHFSPDLTAFVGPWGLSYAANITSDSATGIGGWSEADFVNAIRKGKHMGMDNARPIMPPMPWDNYRNLSDDDLKSIYAYLQSTPAVSNRVHEPFSPEEVHRLQIEKNK